VVLAVAGGVGAARLTEARVPVNATPRVPVGTAAVIRTDLSTTTQLSGTLTYARTYAVSPQLAGTITALPAPGRVIRRGQRLYEVDGAPVFLFYGQRPAWRGFTVAMTEGADVRQLQRNLLALGFGAGLTVDGCYDWATEQAVYAWQRRTHQPMTGIVDLGRVVFEPDALRIASDRVTVGAPASPGQPVLTGTSTQPIVRLPVPVTQAYLVHRGDRVTVTVPSGSIITGRVSGVSAVASFTSGDQAGNGSPQPSVLADVRLARPAAAADLDQAPVTVNVVHRLVRNVLAVPVTALVALAGGGYGVWVEDGAGRRLVGVTPGLFTDARVEISAPGLRPGDRVEVPTQ
jgi:hypothetical protein